MRGQQRIGFVTSPPASNEVKPPGMGVGQAMDDGSGSARDVNHNNTLTTIEITPVKAPSDIKIAIRRQKRTENVDYIWHALPVTRTARPLYRAVLRGSIQPGSIQYTITNVNGHAFKTSSSADTPLRDDLSSSSNDPKNFKTNNQSAFGLKVAGLSITDIKFQDFSGRMSPRAKQVQGQGQSQVMHVSRYMKPNFMEQRNSTSSDGFRNRNTENNPEEGRLVRESMLKNANGVSLNNNSNHCNTKYFHSKTSSGNSVGGANKSQRFSSLTADDSSDQPLLKSPSPANASTNTNWSDSNNKNKTNVAKGMTKNNIKHNDEVSLNLSSSSSSSDSTGNTIPAFEPGIHRSADRDTTTRCENMILENKNSGQEPSARHHTNDTMTESANQMTAIQSRSPRPAETAPPHFNPRDAFVQSLSCIQLANTIIGSVNGDLSSMYSLCKSKMRYSDFIEQSQPHRLGNSMLSGLIGINDIDHDHGNVTTPSQRAGISTPADMTHTTTVAKLAYSGDFSSRSQSASVAKETSPRLPNISTPPQKAYLHLRTSSGHPHVTNPYTRVRDPQQVDSDRDRSPQVSEMTLNLGKAGRPILKTVKSDVEARTIAKDGNGSGGLSNRGFGDKGKTNGDSNNNVNGKDKNNNKYNNDDNNNNNNNNNNNRLVRFNTCHEVREFTPSEPIMLQ